MKYTLLLALIISSCATSPLPTPQEQPTLNAPQTQDLLARRQDIVETIHGVEVQDPYRWLENWEDPEVKAWTNAQDAHTRSVLQALPVTSKLMERFSELYYVDSIQPPVRRGSRYFYVRRHADREKMVYYFREGREGEEQLLLDPNTLSEDGSVSVGFAVASHDGEKLAYSLKENNADEATLYVMNVADRSVSEIDVIPGIKYGRPSWTADSTGFYYVYLPPAEDGNIADRPGLAEVRYHTLGTSYKEDPLIREATRDARIFTGIDLSRDGRFLVHYRWTGWHKSEVFIKDLEGDGDFVPAVEGRDSLYSMVVHDKNIYVLTNEGAPRFRVMKASALKPGREAWKEFIPEFEDGAVIENIQIIGGKLVVALTRDVVSDILIYELDGTLSRDIELPGPGVSLGMTGNPEDDEAYFSFQSFTQPQRIYRTSIATGVTSLWNEVQVPVDPSPYLVEQVFYPSKDGTKIPMFIVRRKDIKLDGSTPTLLYGYGGFSVNQLPYFRASIYPWLEAGGVWAVANLRGGGEYGQAWHHAGIREKKQNVFDDFIAAAEYLINKGYTVPERLAIRGGSNGGLLVGAVMAQRPELFGAVVCAVPLLDMVRYHLFGSGKTWTTEYGDPEVAEDFSVLHAYSPYHQLEVGQKYPAFLMLAADSDDRVDPMHARKFTAALQHAQGGDAPVLLRLERNSGHGGADKIRSFVESDAETYAFLMHVFNM